MQTLTQRFGGFREPAPEWLASAEQASPGEIQKNFLESRVLYYPGSGLDGGPMECVNRAQACHCFLYADYGVPKDRALRETREAISGYGCITLVDLKLQGLLCRGRAPDAKADERPRHFIPEPYGFLAVLERHKDIDEEHGSHRFALAFIGADGFVTFEKLFIAHRSIAAPWCIVLQDHGFGGNYDRFGGNGLLERLAGRAACYPEFLLVGENTEAWRDYRRVETLPERMGQHGTKRYLWERVPEA